MVADNMAQGSVHIIMGQGYIVDLKQLKMLLVMVQASLRSSARIMEVIHTGIYGGRVQGSGFKGFQN